MSRRGSEGDQTIAESRQTPNLLDRKTTLIALQKRKRETMHTSSTEGRDILAISESLFRCREASPCLLSPL